MSFLIVFLMRLLFPLTIFRWPLFGILLSALADALDIVILRNFGWSPLNQDDYQEFDKIFDIYYLSFAVFIASSWQEVLERRTAVGLFLWRLMGVIIFEITNIKKVFLFTPNIFEFFYIFVLAARKLFPRFKLNKPIWLVVVLVVIGIPKLFHEYVLHFLGYPLGIANTLNFLKNLIF